MHEPPPPPDLLAAPLAPAVAAWLAAHEAGDDQAALALAAGLVDPPLGLRLCLPACWRRARGQEGFEGQVEALVAAARGPEKALLAVAAARLHPAALGLAGGLGPLLLFAAAQGALLGGRDAAAGRWFLLCAAPGDGGSWRLAAASAARAERQAAAREATRPWPAEARLPSPPGPQVALRIAMRLAGRARALLARGRPREALGAFELAIEVGAGTRPAGVPAGDLLAAAELRALLGFQEAAREGFDAAEEAARGLAEGAEGAEGGAEVRGRIDLGRARLALEADDTGGAIALLDPLIKVISWPDGQAEALCLRGAAEAALGRWAEGDEHQRAALARLREGGEEEGARAAGCLHWLGLGQLSRGELAEAEALLRRACELWGAALWSDHPDRARSLVALGAALEARGRLAEAEGCGREAFEALRRGLGGDDPRTIEAASRLAGLLLVRRRWGAAEPLVLDLLARAARGPEATRSEELGRWREASERVRVGQAEQARRGGVGLDDEGPIEEAIGTAALDDGAFLRRLVAFGGYVALVHRESGGLLTLGGYEGLASGALVFTDGAQADAFLQQAPAEVRGWFTPMTMDGHTLFGLLPAQRVDGLIFNCLGPWPRATPSSLGAAALRWL